MKTHDWNKTDRGVSYALQHENTARVMHTFVRGTATHIELPLDKAGFAHGHIEFTANYTLNKFTRTQVYNGLAKAAKRAAKHMTGCSTLPTKAGQAGAKAILTTKWELAGGANKGKKVLAVMQGLAYARRADRAAEKAVALQAAVSSGTAYIAEGVVAKDGANRVFAERSKAVKAWVRNNHPLKGEWWTDKVNKTTWMVKAEGFVSLAPEE